jgi:GxxExxY protein
MTLKEGQEKVDQWINSTGVRYFSELTNMAILTEEVGEVARIIARKYGEQSFKDSEKDVNLADEFADVLWVLICLANQTGVDLTAAFERNMDKKTKRDAERHRTNEKLKKNIETRKTQRNTEMITQKYINEISYKIIGCAIEVHKQLGPGLLESVYEACFIDELQTAGLSVRSQIYVPLIYKSKDLGGQLKLDLLVEDLIIVENKAVEIMIPLYHAQLLSYLKLSGKPKGLLINFNCENIMKQLVSLVTEEFARLPKE